MPKKLLELAMPIGVVLCILVIYLPLPAWLMDYLLAGNITLAVVLLLAAVFVRSPLELSAFPALLLVTTLGRLALNVATTRLILTRGPIEHEMAAGEVVRAFAQFVTGDHLLVGALIFAILFIVQFVVITKGATRIGEVAARFALDGLPGRQMAIDADLNAGLIKLTEAQTRRRHLLRHADFHGAMDGAAKYVRGDALAGLLITAINIVGGIAFGLSKGMSLGESADVFTKLTIGDGLVAQLPALLISIAAGLLVSRGSDDINLPRDAISQLISNPTVLVIAAAFLVMLGFTSMPRIPLFAIAAVTIGVAWLSSRKQPLGNAPSATGQVKSRQTDAMAPRLVELDPLEIQLGADLINLANSESGGKLLADIALVRKQVAQQFGLAIPKVRVRDNLKLRDNQFEILLFGNCVVRSSLELDKLLVTTGVERQASGPESRGAALPWARDAVWMPPIKLPTTSAGSVFSPSEVVAQSLMWVARSFPRELLTRDAVQQLLDDVKSTYPVAVNELTVSGFSLSRLQRILQQLVYDGVTIRPLNLICETLTESANASESDALLIESVRSRLSRHITERLRSNGSEVHCIRFSPDLENRLKSMSTCPVNGSQECELGEVAESLKRNLLVALQSAGRRMKSQGLIPALIVSQSIRVAVSRLIEPLRPEIFVVGDREISADCPCETFIEIVLSELLSMAKVA